MNAPIVSPRRAFTLIELLVVISILAILMTLLFPAVGRAFDAVKKTQAKNDATQLATAVSAYIAEYGKVPIAASDSENINRDVSLVNVLSGQDDTENPRKITFLEVPRARNGKNGAVSGGSGFNSGFQDSWGNVYVVQVDANYDNVIDVSDGVGQVRKTVVVYSKGDPKKSKDYANSAKFIKSWE